MGAQVLKMAAAGDEGTGADALRVTFDDFWRAYPRRVAKKDALKAWQKIDAALHPKIIEAVTRAKKSDDWRRDQGRYIPYPATYLNGERWEDELEADLTMGECMWNRNGNREYGKGKCTQPGIKERGGIRTVYYKCYDGRKPTLGSKGDAARFDKPMADRVLGQLTALGFRDLEVRDEHA